MATPLEQIVDCNGVVITAGSKVKEQVEVGVVTEISESDVDFDDNIMRPVLFNPKVFVKYQTRSYSLSEIYETYWDDVLDYGYSEAAEYSLPMVFRCGDLEVVQ